MQPLSERMVADLESRNMAKESPILVRIFKEELELEVSEGRQDRPLRAAADLSHLPVVGRLGTEDCAG